MIGWTLWYDLGEENMILFLPPETTGKTESTPATARSFYSLDFFWIDSWTAWLYNPFFAENLFSLADEFVFVG